jgi:hypothetical protein
MKLSEEAMPLPPFGVLSTMWPPGVAGMFAVIHGAPRSSEGVGVGEGYPAPYCPDETLCSILGALEGSLGEVPINAAKAADQVLVVGLYANLYRGAALTQG